LTSNVGLVVECGNYDWTQLCTVLTLLHRVGGKRFYYFRGSVVDDCFKSSGWAS